MPSTTPPNLPHHAFGTNSSHNSPATTRVGTISTHSWGRYGSHQPAAIYDTASGLYSHAPFRHEDYVSTDHIYFPPSLTPTSPAQQQSPSAIHYPSPMSWHPARAYPHHTQWQSTSSLADPHASTSVPPVAHKVWLLECKHCRTFLTNRGMKVRLTASLFYALSPRGRLCTQAVLLLRPNVPLYSTDALPVNCSAYSARPPSVGSPQRQPNEQQPRTCECLTQTLCCHGCGTAVGYMIVVPVRFPISYNFSHISIFTIFIVRPMHIFELGYESRDEWSSFRVPLV